MSQPQIDMETPKIEVEYNGKLYRVTEMLIDMPECAVPQRKNISDVRFINDRASLHTSLVAAVEGLEQEHHYNTSGIDMDLVDREKIKNIINSIFKE